MILVSATCDGHISPQRVELRTSQSLKALLRLSVCFSLACSLLTALPAKGLEIKGRIVSEQGPIPHGRVLCFDGTVRLMLGPEPAKLDGSFRIHIKDSQPLSHVRCEFSATGFESQRIALVVVNGSADVGEVRLRKIRTLRAHPLAVLYSADGQYSFVETLVVNEGSGIVEVRQVTVEGTARGATGCLDFSPRIIFRLPNNVSLAWLKGKDVPVEIEVPAESWSEAIEAAGEFEDLPCNQKRLRLQINFSFALDAGERGKIRIAIPRTLALPSGASTTADLKDWFALVMKLSLSEGQTVNATLLH